MPTVVHLNFEYLYSNNKDLLLLLNLPQREMVHKLMGRLPSVGICCSTGFIEEAFFFYYGGFAVTLNIKLMFQHSSTLF